MHITVVQLYTSIYLVIIDQSLVLRHSQHLGTREEKSTLTIWRAGRGGDGIWRGRRDRSGQVEGQILIAVVSVITAQINQLATIMLIRGFTIVANWTSDDWVCNPAETSSINGLHMGTSYCSSQKTDRPITASFRWCSRFRTSITVDASASCCGWTEKQTFSLPSPLNLAHQFERGSQSTGWPTAGETWLPSGTSVSVRLSELDSRRDHESTSRKRKVTGWLFRKGTSIYYCPSMCQAWRQSVWRHAPNPQKQFAVTPAISSIPTCGRGWWCLKTPWSWLTMIIPLRALLYCHITSAVIPDA